MGRYTKVVAENRKARFDYHIIETLQAGIVLKGTEVKSIRQGKVDLKESFARVEKGEVWLYGMHISPYEHGNIHNHDPLRTRKLMLKEQEIDRLVGKVNAQGLTLIPLKVVFDGNWAKVELALAKAKQQQDKRAKLKEKATQKEVEKIVASVFKGKG